MSLVKFKIGDKVLADTTQMNNGELNPVQIIGFSATNIVYVRHLNHSAMIEGLHIKYIKFKLDKISHMPSWF